MAAGLAQSVVATDTINGDTTDTTVLTPTAGARIVGVFVKSKAPEISITGIVSDATGDSVTVSYKTKGLAGVTYPIALTVFEVTDA